MEKTTPPIPFAGSELREFRHICAFFNGDDEKYRVLLPFIKHGFECGDKAVHIVNAQQRPDHLQRLREAGIDPAASQVKGQLEVLANTEVYLRDGQFDQERMLRVFEQLASGNAKGGFPLSRIICQMDWVSDRGSYVNDIVAFESRVNRVWRCHDDAVVCVYDLRKFSGDTVIAVMRTHPMIIIGGILHQNPFFVPPDEFLAEIRAPRTGETGSEPTTA